MPIFSNQHLVLLIENAADIVSSDLCLTGTDCITIDGSGCVTNPVDDKEIGALVLMQTECLIAQRDYNLDLAAGAIGVVIKDGEQTVDTGGRATAREGFFNSPHSPCGQYDKRIKQVKINRNLGGKLVW